MIFTPFLPPADLTANGPHKASGKQVPYENMQSPSNGPGCPRDPALARRPWKSQFHRLLAFVTTSFRGGYQILQN
uniref:Uncharacterized protein n=1 Tax=Sciurus vulgaris TaxID=55149 RepID=A0A8D2D3W8_SCIVU